LWRKLDYPRNATPSARALESLLRRAGRGLSEVSIDIDQFRFNSRRFQSLFSGYNSIKHLTLTRINGVVIDDDEPFPLRLEQLTHLTFTVVRRDPGWGLLASFVKAAPNLEYINASINLVTAPPIPFPPAPKLRYLKLAIELAMQVPLNGLVRNSLFSTHLMTFFFCTFLD
jgi:hypothetical protein